MKLKRLIRLASVCLVLIEMSAFGQGALDDWADRMQRSRPEIPATSRTRLGRSAKTLSKANADAFAEDRAIAEASLPFPLPEDARWSRLETPEAEYLSECVFSSPDGFACRFAVYGQYGCKRAYYWTGARAGTVAGGSVLTYDQGTNFVAAVLSRKGLSVDVRGVREVLVSAETEITVRGDVVDCPFDRFRFILADDRPGANWAHPCRFVFIAEDGRSFAVSYESWKPQIRRKTDGKRLWLLPGFHTARQVGLDEVKNDVYSSVPNGTGPDAAFYAGDVSHSYFVLICGGATAEDNGIRFWADTAFMYSTLTKKYGVASDHIHVLMSDGLDPSADACLGETTEGEPVLVSSPTDLDGDGTVDVDRTASWNNLCEVFNGLKSTLTAQDQLVVFVTSHGNSRGTAGESNYDCRASLYSPTGDQYDEDRNYANFTDENLQYLTKDIKCPIAFAFETCFSGGFIDDLTSTANRMVATACNHYEYSWGTGMTVSGPWTGTGIGKTRSHNRWARPFTAALRGYQPSNASTSTYPWLDGTVCADAADADGDGKACFGEAVTYAYANDAKVCTRTTHSSTLCANYEHPQYGESPTGLGASFGLLKQSGEIPVSRPVNDNFVNATAISGTSGSLTASSANATKETGEPSHGISSATNSVWWKWTATAAGSMTITTEGSGFDTGLGVYTGSSVSALTKIGDNDDNGAGGLWSSVTFSAVAGMTYYIAVAGYKGATGSVKLNWNIVSEGFTPSIGLTSLYAVIDLSAGPTASTYPVSELEAVPQGGWTEEYKTTKLVLRRIAPGTFVMGHPSPVSYAVPPVNVTFTNAFYAGVFAVTQRQWELVTGKRPSYFNNDAYYASRPVESVSWNLIRGSGTSANWPSATGVSDSSFMGVLRRKTGLGMDLPTEAQWEYACRAGTTTELNSGKSATAVNMSEVGRCADGSTPTVDATVDLSLGTPKVGSYQPNDWGLYDMHGVIGEWCLDYYLERNKYPTAAVTNTFGPVSGTFRVHRGGSWYFSPSGCASSARSYDYSSTSDWSIGLRVFCSAEVTNVSPGLSAPTGLSAADGSSSSSVFVSWNAVVGATLYTIWRSTTPEVSQAVKIATVTGTSYSDSEPAYYAVNYYWVKAENASEESGFSAPDSGYRYQANTHLLKYDANGGTGTMANEIRSTLSSSPLAKNSFVRSGYAFLGWATTPTATSTRYLDGQVTKVSSTVGEIVTLYAVWAPHDAQGLVIQNHVVQGWTNVGITDIVIPEGVWTVNVYALQNAEVTSVGLPDSLKAVYGFAFADCKSLTNVVCGAGLTNLYNAAFSGCSSLRSITLSEALVEIGTRVFFATGLTELDIPASVAKIGQDALSGCTSLTKLVLRGRVATTYASNKWGSNLDNSKVWVMRADADYWQTVFGTGFNILDPETPVSQAYEVAYNPGTYGSGTQQTATKTNGVALALKGAIFTRTGYTQTGWSTAQAGTSKAYNLDASYTADAAITLYPYWTANTYSIAYALGTGGAHGTTHPTSATYGTAFYVSAPTRSGYTFAGWTVTSGLNTSTAKWGTSSSPSTTISSSSTKCANGATGNVYFKNLTPTENGSVTLTANWTAVIPLSTALDNTALTFTTGGDAGWFGQSANTHDGTDAARSGAITDNQNSWMQTTVTGPGTISFWWYASCEGSTYDYLSFSVDGVQTNKIGGTSCSWTQCSYTLGAGMHTMKWNYRKDGSVNSGLDAGFVDQLTWIPGAPVPTTYQVTFVKGTGVSAVYYRLSNSGSWTLYTAPFSVEKDAVVYYYVTPMSGYTVSCSSANPVHVTITGVATINVSADPIPKTLYVAADGSDAQSGDEGAPLATIQAAIDRAPDGSVVLVGPGVYAPISTEGKRIVIRGVDGPGLTVIDGGWTNRCAHLGSTTNTVLEGLTLRNGAAGYWSPYDGYVRFEEDGGGAYGGTLLNCHVVGNTARSGGGCVNTVLRNCKVRGNAATRYGGGAYYSSSLRNCLAADGCCFFNNMVGVIEHNGLAAGSALYVDFASQVKVRNCIVAANVCDRYGDGGAVVAYYGTDGCALQNCTVVNNRGGMSGGDRAVGVSGFSLVNSIIRFNYDDAGRESDIPEFGSRLTISSCCVSALPRSGYTGSGNTTADPKFVDLERQVYRLQAGSPCLNSGSAVTDAGATDAMGRARIAENRIDMGACEGVASGAVVTSEVVGDGLVLEPGDVLAPNESIVFTAVETRRRFVNFTASNGATTTDKVIRLSNVASDTTVVATFERVTFYVDAARPDDLGDGLSCGTAKKTIPAALALCARSDEVIVADGTYGAFTVPVEDVTVRSVNGPERTVIDAGGKRRCVDFSTPDGGEIVAALEGFTLCNGQTAYAGGGAYGGILKRCIVRDNVAGTAGGGLYGCRAENTIIVRNSSETFGGGAAYSTLVNCSVAGNRTNGEEGGGLYYGQAVNTVVWGNEANGMTDEYSGGSFTNCVTSPLPSGTGNRSNDPRLVDAVNGDVRLRTGSPLKDAGNPSFVAGALDVFGNARVQGSAVDVGAIEGGEVSGHVISVRVKGVGEVSPRTAVVSDGGSVTLMAVETSRPFSHYLLYGLKFSGREQTLTDLMSDLTVTAVFTPYTFYVDAAAKTSGDGLSWATAKRTIQEAVEVAATDETVRVAPGIYSPISTHNKRIVIESEKGPAVTVIDGGQTNRCATLADNSSGHATVLRGFTLAHGMLKESVTMLSVYGAGAYAGTLDRCVVSNCQTLAASAYSYGYGAGLAYSRASNTLIVNNIASNYLSYAGTYYADLKNCTVTGNRAVSGTWQYGGTYYGTADNCIIWGNEGGDRNNSYGTALKYCCVDSSSTSRGTGCVVADPQFVDAANGDYRLAIGSPCIGAGLLVDADVGEVDLDGLVRVVNGTIDIGAYEWQNGVVIPRSSEGAVVIPLDWFSTGKIGGLSVFSPSHFAALFGTDYAIAAKKPTGKVDAHGNPMYVWQDFIAGTDPTDQTSEFKASISFVDGKPVITWTPDLNEGGARSIRTYRTLGINDLSQSADPAAWREVTPGNESAYKFFKVEVEVNFQVQNQKPKGK